ncbi:MAG: hypothetical protein AVDCRST_MAG54-3851 [uncultured Actinomycetospora sp.]|uniref:Uncharacterized protein n=1 Tax=uncultured Actinomycetospora sp. TaxID=1135996 RepID=A0A6J4JPH2_9PSEU|nr:MAG: hypothetical protein AVDCRST_MAG54-3851 [uncultured Actinomycetospora sp.]
MEGVGSFNSRCGCPRTLARPAPTPRRPRRRRDRGGASR